MLTVTGTSRGHGWKLGNCVRFQKWLNLQLLYHLFTAVAFRLFFAFVVIVIMSLSKFCHYRGGIITWLIREVIKLGGPLEPKLESYLVLEIEVRGALILKFVFYVCRTHSQHFWTPNLKKIVGSNSVLTCLVNICRGSHHCRNSTVFFSLVLCLWPDCFNSHAQRSSPSLEANYQQLTYRSQFIQFLCFPSNNKSLVIDVIRMSLRRKIVVPSDYCTRH